MADVPRYMIACLHTGRLALLAILVSSGIVLQILACALYNNWWPMLTGNQLCLCLIAYVVWNFSFAFGGDWEDATKFLTGFSVVGSIAIPVILKHAGVIGWGALTMELSSFFIFVSAILCCIQMNHESEYSSF
ncbi:hypothetical protein ACHQM5_027543 [Ranunculus cassubicifolius]